MAKKKKGKGGGNPAESNSPRVTEVKGWKEAATEVHELPVEKSLLEVLLEKRLIFALHSDVLGTELEIVDAQIDAEQARVNVTSKGAKILGKAKVGKATTFKVEDLALALAVAPLFTDNITIINFTKSQVAAYPDMVALLSEAGLKRATLIPKTREDGSTYWDMRARKARGGNPGGNPGGNVHKCKHIATGKIYPSKRALCNHLGITDTGASARTDLAKHNVEFEDIA